MAYSSAATAFRWLELLEKEFDKAFVDLDLLFGEIDVEQIDITFECRHRMTALSAAFAQLCHKAQTIFQSNAKLEAQLIDLRSKYAESEAKRRLLEGELNTAILQIHQAQLELQHKSGNHTVDSTAIQKKLEAQIEDHLKEFLSSAIQQEELHKLRKEHNDLNQYVLSLQSELYGARLAAKYLDKELAGRIQQIQLLGREMRSHNHDRLWNQLEAEIHLHRHKTVVRACQGRRGVGTLQGRQSGKVRTIVIEKAKDQGLGMSITGGREHGVPILISEIHPGQLADQSKDLFVGDAILSVNNISLENVRHSEAVNVLSQQTGRLQLDVVYIPPDDEVQDDDVLSYKFDSEDVGINSNGLSSQLDRSTPLSETETSTSSTTDTPGNK